MSPRILGAATSVLPKAASLAHIRAAALASSSACSSLGLPYIRFTPNMSELV